MSRVLWPLWNLVQAVFLGTWSVGWISVALVVRAVTGREGPPLWMARRIWSPGLLAGAGARLEVIGAERLDPAQAYLFASTHASQIDVPALFMAVPRPVRFVVKEELRRMPWLGWYLRATGMVFLRRIDRRGSLEQLEDAARLLRAGQSVLVFPEGTRSRDGRLRPFKTGVFLPALEAGVPVVPVAVAGADAVLPPGGFRVRPGPIRVTFGEPIPTTGLDRDDRHELAARVRAAIEATRPA